MKYEKNVYGITGDSKDQITCLCAANAVGEVIPPMQIFPGERFWYNPTAHCIPGVYFALF